jgi:hypothetical protein
MQSDAQSHNSDQQMAVSLGPSIHQFGQRRQIDRYSLIDQRTVLTWAGRLKPEFPHSCTDGVWRLIGDVVAPLKRLACFARRSATFFVITIPVATFASPSAAAVLALDPSWFVHSVPSLGM